VEIDLHADVTPIAFLLGTWQGEGAGEYPTISSFGYGEELVFGHVGKAFLTYTQRTRAVDDGRALHAETGYFRCHPPAVDDAEGTLARLEVVIAQPTGVAEILLGTAVTEGEGVRLNLRCDHLLLAPTAKDVRALSWTLHWDGGDRLHERLAMAAMGKPMTHHLSADLHRVA
jgi:hypothetical protein